MNRPHPGPQAPSGVLLVDKSPDMTSHDVVAIARRSLGTKKIGHCGTLDPMATGLLMLVVERATKIQDLLMSEDKEYEGTLTLGAPRLTNRSEIGDEPLAIAASLAAHSRHPYSQAIAAAASGTRPFDAVAEHPGLGVEARRGPVTCRLGRASWALGEGGGESGTVLARNGTRVATFAFEDATRPDAAHGNTPLP